MVHPYPILFWLVSYPSLDHLWRTNKFTIHGKYRKICENNVGNSGPMPTHLMPHTIETFEVSTFAQLYHQSAPTFTSMNVRHRSSPVAFSGFLSDPFPCEFPGWNMLQCSPWPGIPIAPVVRVGSAPWCRQAHCDVTKVAICCIQRFKIRFPESETV